MRPRIFRTGRLLMLMVLLGGAAAGAQAPPTRKKPGSRPAAPAAPDKRATPDRTARRPAAALSSDAAYLAGSYREAASGYARLRKSMDLKDERRAQVEFRYVRSLGLSNQWDASFAVSHELVKSYEGSEWEVRFARWLMELYLRVPHRAVRQGKLYKRVLPGQAVRGRVLDTRADDYRRAVQYGEQAWLALGKGEHPGLNPLFRAGLAADLARLLGLSLPAAPVSAVSLEAYEPEAPAASKLLFLLDAAAAVIDGERQAELLLEQALWRMNHGLDPRPPLSRILADHAASPRASTAAYLLGLRLAEAGETAAAREAFALVSAGSDLEPLARWRLQERGPVLRPLTSTPPGKPVVLRWRSAPKGEVEWTAQNVKLDQVFQAASLLKQADVSPWEPFAWIGPPDRWKPYLAGQPVTWRSEAGQAIIECPLTEPGAYLIQGRSDGVEVAALALITSLKPVLWVSPGGIEVSAAPAASNEPVRAVIRERYRDGDGTDQVSAVTRDLEEGSARKAAAPRAAGDSHASVLLWSGSHFAIAGPVTVRRPQPGTPIAGSRLAVSSGSFAPGHQLQCVVTLLPDSTAAARVELLNGAGKAVAAAAVKPGQGSAAPVALAIPRDAAPGLHQLAFTQGKRQEKIRLMVAPALAAAPPPALGWSIQADRRLVATGDAVTLRATGPGLPVTGLVFPLRAARRGSSEDQPIALRRQPDGAYSGEWRPAAPGWYDLRPAIPGANGAATALTILAGAAESSGTDARLLMASGGAAPGAPVELIVQGADAGDLSYFFIDAAGRAHPATGARAEAGGPISLPAPETPGIYYLAGAAGQVRLLDPSPLVVAPPGASPEAGRRDINLAAPDSPGARPSGPWLLTPRRTRFGAADDPLQAVDGPSRLATWSAGEGAAPHAPLVIRARDVGLPAAFFRAAGAALGLPGSPPSLRVTAERRRSAPPASAPAAPAAAAASGAGDLQLPATAGLYSLLSWEAAGPDAAAAETILRAWGPVELTISAPGSVHAGDHFRVTATVRGVPPGLTLPLALTIAPPLVDGRGPLAGLPAETVALLPAASLLPLQIRTAADGSLEAEWWIAAAAAGESKLSLLAVTPFDDVRAEARVRIQAASPAAAGPLPGG